MSNLITGAGGGCFRKGTLVLQENGKTTTIEDLKIGDSVLAFDDKNNIYLAKVIKTHYHEVPQPILHVKYWGGELFATPNHWVVNQLGTFAELGTLTTEDALQDGLGHLRPIISKEVVAYEPVYNLTVEPHHTFIANNIRVHNGGHRETYPIITGAGGGGKGGGGSGRPAVEAANTLKSTQYAEIIDVISEGEIGGLVDGAKSIYFDDVPLVNSDGSYNYSDINYYLRTGTQNQDPVPSATSGVATTKLNPSSSTEIKYGPSYAQEVAITNVNVKLTDVTINIPSLTTQDTTTGDLNGGSVSFKIYYKAANTGYILAHDATISGKCTSSYQKSYRVDFSSVLEANYPIILRVERTKADATTVSVQDKMYWQSYTEHIPTRLSYPNTALVNIKIDAEQFSQIPTRGYEIYGIKVKVPTNYDPTTRLYSGIWDGTFKVAWTNNPAWIFYDLLIEDRYGLGGFITEANIDKWSLYTIAQYCDQQVPTGTFSSTGAPLYEPRFTCNTYIYSQEEAYTLLTSIASVFRAIQYWALGQFSLSADMPKDAMMQFSPANVIDGQFSYNGSSLKTRHTVAAITWNDPQDLYRQKVEYVEDVDAISKWGIIQTEAIAFGCTSRGQAHRLGKWLLYSEQMETETVTFKTGIENCVLLPGDIIKTTDPFRAGERYGGRILTKVSNNAITIDGDLPNGYYTFSLYYTSKDINTGALRGNTWVEQANCTNGMVVLYSDMPSGVTTESLWVAAKNGVIEPEYWRVIAIKEEEDHLSATITALEYRPDKFAAVEDGLILEERPVSTINYKKPEKPYIDNTVVYQGPITINGTTYQTYTNEQSWLQEYLYYAGPSLVSNGVTLSWTGKEVKYLVKWKLISSTVWEQRTVDYPYIDIKPLKEGDYNLEIYAINKLNRMSDAFTKNFTIYGKKLPPNSVTGLEISKSATSINISWNSNKDSTVYTSPDLDLDGYEIRELYTTSSTHPYTKLVNGILIWKTKAELGSYLGKTLTDAQYAAELNSIWDDVSNNIAESGLIYNTSYIDLFSIAGYNYFLIKAVDTTGNYSSIPALIGIQIKAPNNVDSNSIQSRIDGQDLVITWTKPQADLSIDKYIITIDNQQFTTYNEEFRKQAWFIGTEVFEITPYDIYGNTAPKTSINITILDNLAPQNLSYSLVDDLATSQVINDSFKLVWSESIPAGLSLPIVEYEVRLDTNWGQNTNLIAKTNSKQYVSRVTWSGAKTLYVGAKNSAGFYTPSSAVTITITSPSAPASVTSKVVDNNVLLFWTAPTAGSLPIDEYVIKKGTNLASAIDIGTKAGNFTTVFETVAGTYTYWVAAKDTAGNIGAYTSTTATVNQPPDYVLQFDYTTAFIGTKTNAIIDSDGNLVLPAYTNETWSSHFTSRSWLTPQDQINAGYPLYVQPVPASASYVETIDYGTTLIGNTITITTREDSIISGSTISYLIETSLNGTTWTTIANAKVGYGIDFRYVRITVTVSGGLLKLSLLNIKIDSKLKTQASSVYANSEHTTGTLVYLTNDYKVTGTKVFKDVQSITVTPAFISGKQPIAIYDFTDTADPLSFSVYLYDSLTGERISGNCSYTVRGV